jgi:iron complex outermembrane receptor protein
VTIARTVRRILLSSACMLGAPAAFAADAPAAGQLESVEVRAQRQAFRGDTPIEQLPQSVQLIDSELLTEVGATQLDDILDLASGVARQNTFGGLWDSFAIRGFAGDENTPTGYLVNGFSAGRGFSGRRDSSNIERIEVVKGPGSALFGRAEPGGTINIITKKPQFTPEGSIEVGAARFSTYRVAADYTAPISQNVAFRINGAYEDADSFRDYIHRKKYVVSPSFLINFTDTTSLAYELEVVNQKAPFDRGVVASPTGRLGVVPISRFLGEPGDGDTEIKANGHQLTFQSQFTKNWGVLVGIGYRKSTFEGFSSDPELVGGRQPYFTDATNLSRQRRFRNYDAVDKSVRAELSGRFEMGSVTNHLLIGADNFKYRLDTLQQRFRPTLANPYSVNVFAPVYGQTRTPGNFQNQREEQEGTGVYLQDQLDLTPSFKVLLGVRHDDFRQDFRFNLTNTVSKVKDTATSPRVGIAYDINPTVNVYASWSKGFRPNTGTDFQNTPFAPEFSKSYEVGTKLTLGDVSGTIAVYKGQKSNVLSADPINAGFSLAAGEAESKGIEVDFAGRITESLNFKFSYAYTDAYVSKSQLDPNFGLALPSGSRLINIPKNSANAMLVQSFDLGGAKATVGGGVTYIGDRLGETGVPTFVLPSYTLFDLTASYAPNEHLKFMAQVDNVFDKEYYPSSYARLWIAPGAPRTYGIRALYKF